MSVPTLETLCCQCVCKNSTQFPNGRIDGLNWSCLHGLVNEFSMYDVLKREQYLEEKGFNTRSILNTILTKGFACREAYPVRSVTCPHLLNVFSGNGLEWALSKLFSSSLIGKAVEVHMIQWKEVHVSLSKLQHDCQVIRFFRSSSELRKEPFKSIGLQLSHDSFKEICALAALKIVHIVINEHLCDFLMADDFKSVFHSLCQSLMDISIVVQGQMPCVLDFLNLLIKSAKNLSRIRVFVQSSTDMEYFDDVLSLCSGVRSLKKSKEPVKAESDLCMTTGSVPNIEDEIELTHERDARPWKVETAVSEGIMLSELSERSEQDSEEFDLMDDAVLFGSVHNTTKFDPDYNGMPKADIKISNLHQEKYMTLLEHHFTSWLSLTQLNLKVPEIQHRIMACLCLIVSRPSFKSLQLSNAVFTHCLLDDLLSCVASKRKSCPLDKLMLVNLQERIPNIQDLLIFNHLEGMSEREIVEFAKQYQSQRIASEGSFHGTKLLEIFGCSMMVQTECLVMQFILADSAITQLCLYDSLSRLFIRATINFLSYQGRKLTQFIVQDWSMSNQEDCEALVCFLHSISNTLEELSLAGCFCNRNAFSLQPVVEAIFSCKLLRSLNLSENNFGDDVMQFVNQVVHAKNLEDLCLRKISSQKEVIEDILAVLASGYEFSKRHLAIVDLRENLPGLRNKVVNEVFNQVLVRKVAKRVLYDKWLGQDEIRQKFDWFCVA